MVTLFDRGHTTAAAAAATVATVITSDAGE